MENVSLSLILLIMGTAIALLLALYIALRNRFILARKRTEAFEYQALTTQINPHFLYNTLDSILWMCEQERAKEAVPMITDLVGFFRGMVSTSSVGTIAEELEHTNRYLRIQQARYPQHFQVLYNVAPTCLSCNIPKIVLQPLLENAIRHGIHNATDGMIEITIQEIDTDILILVSDNGVGMKPEKTNMLMQMLHGKVDIHHQISSNLNAEFQQDKESLSTGIGLYNVNRRLRLFYGKQYGLTIISAPDEGTSVQILIPRTFSQKTV